MNSIFPKHKKKGVTSPHLTSPFLLLKVKIRSKNTK